MRRTSRSAVEMISGRLFIDNGFNHLATGHRRVLWCLGSQTSQLSPVAVDQRSFGDNVVSCYFKPAARVAKSADATDLKSVLPKGGCGFKSRPGHQQNHFIIVNAYNESPAPTITYS